MISFKAVSKQKYFFPIDLTNTWKMVLMDFEREVNVSLVFSMVSNML